MVRTTHLSGMFTDLGIFLGHAIRGLPVDAQRVRLCFLIITGFFTGGVVSALVFSKLGYGTLYIPGGMTAVASLAYGLGVMRWGR